MTNPSEDIELSRLFQAQYQDFEDDIELYLQLAEMFGGPILELGCGNGRVLLKLAQAGYSTVGVDYASSMLRQINNKGTPPLPIDLVQATLEQLPLAGAFPLILSPCSTLGYFGSEALKKCLVNIRRTIAAEGRLIMDLPAPNQSPLEAGSDEVLEWFHEPQRGTDVQVSAIQKRISYSIYEVEWYYDEMQADGRVQRHRYHRRYHLRSLKQLKQIMAGSGFVIEQAFGDYQRGALVDDSPGLILIAKRKS